MKPTVIWWSSEQRGSWSCVNMLNEMFNRYDCRHICAGDTWPDVDGAIVVIHGGNEQLHGRGPSVAKSASDCCRAFRWVIFVNIGDEQSEFPNHLLQHENSKLWLQTPLPSQQADRYLIEGYPAGTQAVEVERDLDWFFAGQINHERREKMQRALYDAASPTPSCSMRGKIFPTDGFGKGMPHEQYVSYMSRARLVPCPSGPATPDSFRMAEALECGAIPILDSRSLNENTIGFWDHILPIHPLPIIDDWADLPAVMKVLLEPEIYEQRRQTCRTWWELYKARFFDSLGKDLIALGAM